MRRLAPLLVAGLTVCAEGPLASAQTHPRLERLQIPSTGCYLGEFVSLSGHTRLQSVALRERELGRRLAIDSHYYAWTDPFPTRLEAADVTHGRTPMITWAGTTLASIVNGSQDALIRARARAVKAFGAPVLLRWAPEMNGDWNIWSGAANGDDPALYVAAWRHIHDIFTQVGASNVSWVWAPNAASNPGGTNPSSWNAWNHYYPGNAYVDWVGIDGYNWGSLRASHWQSFGQIMAPIYDEYAGRKPIMIAETGSVGTGPEKAAWISGAGQWVEHHQAVRALIYFDTNDSRTRINWQTGSSPAAFAAFRALARAPYFSIMPPSLPPAG